MPAKTRQNGVILWHCPMAHDPALMDLLRNVRPLYVTSNPARGIGAISSDAEPVGEQAGL